MAGPDTLIKEKITREEAEKFVKSRSWYQTIKFEDDLISNGCAWCGEMAWEHMTRFLPKSLEGKRVLDLGCNAGFFCVKAALMGAKEVVGVDWPGWRPGWDFAEQRVFVKDYFEQKLQRQLPIIYYEEKMEDFLKRPHGYFDYVFAIASIYYTDNPEEVVNNISYLAENVIVRLRGEEIISRFSRLFTYSGYLESLPYQEACWNELNTQTDDFYLYLYQKNRDVSGYRLMLGHRVLLGNDELINIWQLMNLVGTEIPIEKYHERIPKQFITYVPLNKFHNHRIRFMPTEYQKKDYPWEKLAESIKNRGLMIPIIAKKLDDGIYLSLEGRHRLSALDMLEPYNPEFLVPCVIVEEHERPAKIL